MRFLLAHLIVVGILFTTLISPQTSYAHIIPTATHTFILKATEQETALTILYYFDTELALGIKSFIDQNNDGTIDPNMHQFWIDKIRQNVQLYDAQKKVEFYDESVNIPDLDAFINLRQPVALSAKLKNTFLCNRSYPFTLEIIEKNVFTDRAHEVFTIQQDKQSCISTSIQQYTDEGFILEINAQKTQSLWQNTQPPTNSMPETSISKTKTVFAAAIFIFGLYLLFYYWQKFKQHLYQQKTYRGTSKLILPLVGAILISTVGLWLLLTAIYIQ